MKFDTSSSYIPIPSSPDLFINLVYHSRRDNVCSDLNLKCLLNGEFHKDPICMFVFEATGYGLFVLWTAHATTTTTNSLDDALAMSQDFIKETTQRQICILFKSEGAHGEGLDQANSPILAVLARYDQELQHLLGISAVQQDEAVQTPQITKYAGRATKFLWSTSVILFPSPLSRRIWPILGVIVCTPVILVLLAKLILMSNQPPDIFHSWMAYDTRGSVGPKYQLSLTGQNVSTWNSYIHNAGEWGLRLDDQAIIPLHLMDENEHYYQEWFQNRYPEMNQIRLNQDYLNETWLSSTFADQVPVDDLFHFSHCVLALKRYIKAKQTGRHVCGRDIDHDHMMHCLDALDWWAFPSGKHTETIPNPQRPFWWKTKVCFD